MRSADRNRVYIRGPLFLNTLSKSNQEWVPRCMRQKFSSIFTNVTWCGIHSMQHLFVCTQRCNIKHYNVVTVIVITMLQIFLSYLSLMGNEFQMNTEVGTSLLWILFLSLSHTHVTPVTTLHYIINYTGITMVQGLWNTRFMSCLLEVVWLGAL